MNHCGSGTGSSGTHACTVEALPETRRRGTLSASWGSTEGACWGHQQTCMPVVGHALGWLMAGVR